MNTKIINIGDIRIGGGNPIVLISGPCVIESAESAIEHAKELKKITARVNVPFIFKASFDKANRSAISSFRGPGLEEGLAILKRIKEELDVPVLSDIHSIEQVEPAGKVLDIIQIPAFLCRQTDLVVKAAEMGKPINVKKGQFMSPEEMINVIRKVESTGNEDILLTERGTFFGYNTLVNDFRALIIMRDMGYPVVYDATHSVQKPGGQGTSSGGDSKFVGPLSRAAVSVGCDALFLEVHKDPLRAKSDGPNMLRLDDVERFLNGMIKVEKVVKTL